MGQKASGSRVVSAFSLFFSKASSFFETLFLKLIWCWHIIIKISRWTLSPKGQDDKSKGKDHDNRIWAGDRPKDPDQAAEAHIQRI